MDYTLQFNQLVNSMIKNNHGALNSFSRKELEAECWAAVAAAVQRWDGSKGKLSSLVYRNRQDERSKKTAGIQKIQSIKY
jgi:hypothetical protein